LKSSEGELLSGESAAIIFGRRSWPFELYLVDSSSDPAVKGINLEAVCSAGFGDNKSSLLVRRFCRGVHNPNQTAAWVKEIEGYIDLFLVNDDLCEVPCTELNSVSVNPTGDDLTM
jgi:hypothetical protein